MPLDPARPTDSAVKYRGRPDFTSPNNGPRFFKGMTPSKLPYNPVEAGYSEDDIIAGVTPLISNEVSFFARDLPDHIKDDLFSIGLESAKTALDNYDGSSRFTSYSAMRIKAAISRAANYYRERGGPVASNRVAKNIGKGDVDLHTDKANVDISHAGDIESPSDDEGQSQEKMAKMLAKFFVEAGLSEKVKIVMMATYGIDNDGNHTKKGPASTNEIANTLKVSQVRISQIRKKATEKIKQYVQDNKLSMEEKTCADLLLDHHDVLIRINYRLIWD